MEYIILDAQSDLLKEIKRYNNIKEKELEFRKDVFAHESFVNDKNVEANLTAAKATEELVNLMKSFQSNLNVVSSNQNIIYNKMLELEKKLNKEE